MIDGDTIEIHGQRIRLWGIDAPESDQLCIGPDSQPFRCGAAAALALAEKIGSRSVTCSPRDVDRYGRVVALCFAAGEDMLSGWFAPATRSIGRDIPMELTRRSRQMLTVPKPASGLGASPSRGRIRHA